MPEKPRSQSLAVLIDADNSSARHAHAIFEEIVKHGEANVRRIYGDFSGTRLAGWNKQILTLLPDPGPGGKLNTDLEGRDDKADEAAIFAGIQGTVGCPAVGAGTGQEGHDHRSGRIGEEPPGPDFGVNVTTR